MLERGIIVFGQVSTLFLMVMVGFVLGRLKRITAEGTREMTFLLLYIVAPCVIIDSFQIDYDPALLRVLWLEAAVAGGLYFLEAMLVKLFFRREEPDLQKPLRFGSMYGNASFMGLPLIQAVMGKEALIYAVVALMVFNTVVWSHGYLMMSNAGDRFSLKRVFLTPGFFGVVVGLALFFARITLPGPVRSAVSLLGSVNTPLAMVVIGAQMGRADLKAILRDAKLYEAAAIKLLLLPLLAAVVLLPLRGERQLYVATVILSGVSTAGLTSMFGERFDRSPERGAGLVTLTTLLSVLTLPLVTVLAETLAGLAQGAGM